MDLHLEGAPIDDQKERFEDFLTELVLLTRKYGIVLSDPDVGLHFVDAPTGHVIGVGVFAAASSYRRSTVTEYVAVDSILDGVWPVDTPDGPVEQRTIQNVFPRRDA